MVATLFRRAVSATDAVFSISFGKALHPSTVDEIFRHSHVSEENFTGLGRHGEEEQCTELGMYQYQFRVPGVDVWFGTPADLLPPVVEDFVIDLALIRNRLVRDRRAV